MLARDLILAPELQTREVNAFLRDLGFRDPGRADDHLQQITRFVGAPERLADLIGLLLEEIDRLEEALRTKELLIRDYHNDRNNNALF